MKLNEIAQFGGLFFLPPREPLKLPQLTFTERLHRYELDETFRFLYLKDPIGNEWIETAGLQPSTSGPKRKKARFYRLPPLQYRHYCGALWEAL